ncbi:MAG: hypothetical protein OEM93_13730 [Rhodospirillales bacterium]|nr:hypothetical protein [Rhodospirillales bacterium]
MKSTFGYLIVAFAALTFVPGGFGAHAKPVPRPGDVEQGDPWQQAPYDFVFGNHIDTHVQLRLEEEDDAPVSLRGSFYIIFTGGNDSVSGLPLARHPRGASHDERCGIDPITCVVGWDMDGQPGAAKFLYHDGVNGNDHPVWMVNRAEEASAPAPGMVIPQPGYYSHYHWITTTSTDPRAAMVPATCDKNNAGQLQDQAPTAVDEVCDGWFLQIHAVTDFAFEHGGEVIPVRAGEDLRSHLNMVTNYNQTPVVPITPTREGGGH